MIEVSYSRKFLRQLKKLPNSIQEAAIEKISAFQNRENHKSLKVHKLNGASRESYSLSITYEYRALFEKSSADDVTFYAIGDHDIYKAD